MDSEALDESHCVTKLGTKEITESHNHQFRVLDTELPTGFIYSGISKT